MNRWELTIGAPSDSGEHHAFNIIAQTCGEKSFRLRGQLKIHRVSVSVSADDNKMEFGDIFVYAKMGHVCVGYAYFGEESCSWMDVNETFPEGFIIRFQVSQLCDSGIPVSSIIVRLEGELEGTMTPLQE